MAYHAGLGRGDLVGGGPDRIRAASGGVPVMPFGSSTAVVSGAAPGVPFGSTSIGMVSGGNLGATSASRGVQSQAGSWGTGLPPNSDVGERLGY